MFAFKLLPLLFASLRGSWNFGQLLQHLCCCLLKTGRPAIESAGAAAAASQERWRRGSTHTCLSGSQAWVGVRGFLGEERLDSHIGETFRRSWIPFWWEALFSCNENQCFLLWQAASSGTFLALIANLRDRFSNKGERVTCLNFKWIENKVFKDNQPCLITFTTT